MSYTIKRAPTELLTRDSFPQFGMFFLEPGFSSHEDFQEASCIRSLNRRPPTTQHKRRKTPTVILQALLLFAIGWVLRRLIAKSELDNVPGPENGSFLTGAQHTPLCIHTPHSYATPVGNMGQLFDIKSGWDFNDMISERPYLEGDSVMISVQSKNLHIYDPKALHHILVKLIFGGGLLSSQGDQHKKQRKMLNPVFSIVHMRHMSEDEPALEAATHTDMLYFLEVPLFNDVAQRLQKALTIKLASGAQEASHPISYYWPFANAKLSISNSVARVFLEREYFLPILIKIGTPKFRRWVLDRFPFRRYHSLRDIVDTWDRTTTDIFEEKRMVLREGDGALANQVGQAKDLMSILMKANSEASAEDALPDKEVLAQDRLRAEIVEARKAHGGDIPYDDLVALPLMDAICRETLRLYVLVHVIKPLANALSSSHAPVPKVLRVARQDIVLPLSTPIKGLDGTEMDSILVPKNTKMIISILGANTDPLLWGPDALEWKPERWLSPLPEAVHEAHMPGIYSHLLTFLGGGRACIGFKFSQLEMKVVLSSLISQFRFFPPEKEIVWEMSGITTPALKEFPGQPKLPLKMELVNA
ncbi:hypothetical protein DXG01_010431 [Tephrocybe rancida]|nr:hypothetical protein DXG01_010431 [Tephrocybe rancida]